MLDISYRIQNDLSNQYSQIFRASLSVFVWRKVHRGIHKTIIINFISTIVLELFLYTTLVDSTCQCKTSFCDSVKVIGAFLFPFGIEFSIVSSFLLYITFSNVGKHPPLVEGAIKPSYKFFKSYSGKCYKRKKLNYIVKAF